MRLSVHPRLAGSAAATSALACLAAVTVVLAGGAEAQGDTTATPYRVAVLSEEFTDESQAVARRTIASLQSEGFAVTPLNADQLADAKTFNASRYELLVLPSSPVFPASATQGLDRFVRDGGDLVLLGGKSFERMVTKDRGEWLDFDAIRPRLESGRSLDSIALFEDLNIKQWKRHASNGKTGSGLSQTRTRQADALRLDLKDVTQYDTFKANLTTPISDGHNVMVLWSRAQSKKTRQAAFEIRTKAGARWIATIDLDTQWRPTVLQPKDFVYHEGGSAQSAESFSFSEADRLSFGLTKDYGEFEGADHTLMFTVLGTAAIDLASSELLEQFDLFTELPSFQFAQASEASTSTSASKWLGEVIEFGGPIDGTSAFAVPRSSVSQAFPVLETENRLGQPVVAATVVAHYAGPYAGSQWFVCGVEGSGFYLEKSWDRLLLGVAERMRQSVWLRDAEADNPFADAERMRDIIGVTHAGAKYHFTDRDVLNEGAVVLEELGTRTIKLWLPRPHELYLFNHDWPDELNSMVDVVETPVWREVLARPFDTYYLEAFAMPRRFDVMDNGLSQQEARWITQEFEDITRHLLTTYRGTGKTFVLQNWEGDWALRDTMDPALDPSAERIEAMIDWLNARQDGVDRARKAVGEDGVRVLHAAETNLVLQQMRSDRPGVVRDVLPHTRVDLASYSCYDTRGDAHAFRAALEYIAMHLPPTSRSDLGNRVAIGEFGVPETAMGSEAVKRMLPEQVEIATAYGSPHLLYWALYCNELIGDPPVPVRRNEQVNGFWLIRPDGTRTWAWDYFASLFQSDTRP